MGLHRAGSDMPLCNLTQTDAAGALPLPCPLPPDDHEELEPAVDEAATAADPILVQQLLHALRAVDTSYLCALSNCTVHSAHSVAPLMAVRTKPGALQDSKASPAGRGAQLGAAGKRAA